MVSNNTNSNTNNQSIVNVKYTLNDLILNHEDFNNLTCSICFELIEQKEVYQCKEGHWNCKGCWIESLSKKKECMVCRRTVNSINDLSRNRFIEKELLNKKVCCPNSFLYIENGSNSIETIDEFSGSGSGGNMLIKDSDGCKEIIIIEKLPSHLLECSLRFVRCPFIGCNNVMRHPLLAKHKQECKFAYKYCLHCTRNDIGEPSLEAHYLVCPKFVINCTLKCMDQIQRDKLKKHLEDDCPNSLIQCKYCNKKKQELENGSTMAVEKDITTSFKRSELSSHFEKCNHSFEMNTIIEKQEKQIVNLREELNQYNQKYSEILERINRLEISSLHQQQQHQQFLFSREAYRELPKFKNNIIFPNFSTYKSKKVNEGVSSTILDVGMHKFKLTAYPNGYDETNKGYISMYLYRININDPPAKVAFSFIILNGDSRRIKTLRVANYTFQVAASGGWGFPRVERFENVEKIENGWLYDDKFNVKLRIQILE